MDICEVLSVPRSPWQRAYVERVIGSIRRECLDHVIVLHENSLRRTLHSYFDYYHRARTHLSLEKGLTATASDSDAGNGVRRDRAASRWIASPLRTTGCLTEPESTTLRTAFLEPLKFVPELWSLAHACSGFTRLRQGRERQALVDLLLCRELQDLKGLVGASGFEPPSSWSRTKRIKIQAVELA